MTLMGGSRLSASRREREGRRWAEAGLVLGWFGQVRGVGLQKGEKKGVPLG
jgi:hypothetical protein